MRFQGKYLKTFETDILKLCGDELNFTLCMFVKEVKKPNGEAYAADSIFYLVLGVQVRFFFNAVHFNVYPKTKKKSIFSMKRFYGSPSFRDRPTHCYC